MFGSKRQHEFAIWQAPGETPVIIYSLAVVHQLARQAARAEGESTGVLSGAYEDGRVRIAAAGEVPGMVPVGVYYVRARGEIRLTGTGIQIWDRDFPEPWQVALVLCAQENGPVQAGFFFRPAEGPARTESSHLVFTVSPAPENPAPAPPPDLFQLPDSATPRSRRKWLRAALGVLAGAAVLLAGLFWYRHASARQAVPQFGLRFDVQAGQLRAVWDTNSPWVRRARRGTIEINDGGSQVSFLLTEALIRNGSWPVPRKSSDARVRLELAMADADPRNGPVYEIARYVGQPPKPPPSNEAEFKPLRERAARLRANLNQRSKLNDARETLLQALRNALPGTNKAAAPVPAAPPVTPDLPPPALTEAPPLFADRIQPRPLPVSPPPPAYTGPSSGRIIWTGYLPANASLVVDGRLSSIGSLSAALPGAPVRVTVYPAELSSSGLSVYSASPKHAGGTSQEPRSAQNGWMNTRYIYDPPRAGEAQLVAAPASSTGFRQIQIRGRDRPLSALVIDWEVIP